MAFYKKNTKRKIMKKGNIIDRIDVDIRSKDKKNKNLKFSYLDTNIRR